MTSRPGLLPYARYALLIVTGSLVALLAIQTDRYERDFVTHALDWKSIALVVAFSMFLWSAFTLLTRRMIASIALAAGIMVILTIISVVKFQYLRSSLYALDFYYYARPTEIMFLSDHFPRIFLPGLATLVSAIAISFILFVVDDTRMPLKLNLMVFLAAAVLLTAAYGWRGQRSKVYHFNGFYHVSAAVASAPEAMGIFWRGGFLESADKGGKINSDPIAGPTNAKRETKPPTIIAILHESTFQTSLYPVQCGGPAPDALYKSSNGKTYDLRVETFGGATWLTEYGFELGISTYYFGEARSFIGYSMENRVHDSLALQLKQDGYDTVALYPSPRNFVNTGHFYNSIGFEKVLDYYDLGEKTELERDKYFYGKAIDQIRDHQKSGSTKPLFVASWTMSTHAPYDYVIYPGVKPDPGEVCGKSKTWAEYLRRLLIAQDDQKWLVDTLKTEFPDQPFLILNYGDHQPFIAREFLEPSKDNPAVPVKNTIGYKTYYSLIGVNYEPDWNVVPQSIDTPFLGNVLMQAAHLPRHGFYNDRDKLLALCKGRYNDCPNQDEVLSFHQRMVDTSTIVNR